MNKLLTLLLILVGLYCNAQSKLFRHEFESLNQKFNYALYSNPKLSKQNFYIIILEDESPDKILKNISKCGNIHSDFIILNLENQNLTGVNKEQLLFDFINDITSRRKLLDLEMVLILNTDFTNFYSQNRNDRKKASGFLNKINKTYVLKNSNQFCAKNTSP